MVAATELGLGRASNKGVRAAERAFFLCRADAARRATARLPCIALSPGEN